MLTGLVSCRTGDRPAKTTLGVSAVLIGLALLAALATGGAAAAADPVVDGPAVDGNAATAASGSNATTPLSSHTAYRAETTYEPGVTLSFQSTPADAGKDFALYRVTDDGTARPGEFISEITLDRTGRGVVDFGSLPNPYLSEYVIVDDDEEALVFENGTVTDREDLRNASFYVGGSTFYVDVEPSIVAPDEDATVDISAEVSNYTVTVRSDSLTGGELSAALGSTTIAVDGERKTVQVDASPLPVGTHEIEFTRVGSNASDSVRLRVEDAASAVPLESNQRNPMRPLAFSAPAFDAGADYALYEVNYSSGSPEAGAFLSEVTLDGDAEGVVEADLSYIGPGTYVLLDGEDNALVVDSGSVTDEIPRSQDIAPATFQVTNNVSMAVLPGRTATDPDGDGRYEDANGDGATTLADVTAYYNNRKGTAVQSNANAFDYDGDGTPGQVSDALALFEEIADE